MCLSFKQSYLDLTFGVCVFIKIRGERNKTARYGETKSIHSPDQIKTIVYPSSLTSIQNCKTKGTKARGNVDHPLDFDTRMNPMNDLTRKLLRLLTMLTI